MVSILGALGVGAGIAITIRAIDEFSKTFDKASRGIKGLSTVLKVGAVGAVVFAGTMVALGTSSLKAAAEFEQTTIAFTTMLGSAEEAQVFLAELAEFAKKTPFTLQGVERAARQLMAVGFASEDVLPVLKDVGDLASGLGLGEEGLSRLILNLGQVQAQGKLTGRELRDFAVAGIPLLDELSKELGVTTEQVQKMVSAGEIQTDVVLKVFKTMTSEGGRFADLMAKQAETVQGKFSNLQDTFELMQREIGSALLPIVSKFADVLLNEILPALEPLIPVIGEFLANSLQRIVDLFIKLTPFLIEFIENVIEVADEIMGQLMPVLEELIPILLDLGADVFKVVADAIIKLLPVFTELMEDVIIPLIPEIGDLITEFLKLVPVLIEETLPAIMEIVDGLKDIMPVIKDLIPVIEDLLGFFSEIGEWLGPIMSISTLPFKILGEITKASRLEEYQKGGLVSSTGPALVHKGEYITPANQVGGGMTIIIEGNVYGTDPDEMAEAMAIKMRETIRI